MGKIKSSIVAILLILSALLVAMNFAAPVTGPANDSTARAPRLTDTDFHWGDMIVSSEPTIGQDNNDDSFDPEVAVENEKVYMVWYDGTDLNGVGGTYDIFFRMYDGTSWSTIEVLSEPTLGGADDNFGNSEAPDIAVENGNVYVVWIDNWKPPGFSGGDYDILYRHFDGTQWGPIQVISEPNFSGNDNAGESYNPSIAVDNSKVYVVWRDETDITAGGTGDYDIFYRTNLTTTGWEEIQVISETVSGDDLINTATDAPNIAADNGKHYIVWQDDLNFDSSGGDFEIFYRANLTNAWEDLQVISEPIPGQDINTGVSAFPSIAVETDKLYVAWSDNNDTNGASGTNTDFDIFYRCNLTQSNWEATQVLSEPIPNSDTNDGFSDEPDITVENDIIYVIWEDEYDFKNASKNFADTDIFFTYNSSGGGGGWSEFFIVSEPAEEQDINDADSQSDPAIAVNLGKCHIFWDDNNDTDSSGTDRDINYRPTFVAPSLTSPAVTPAIGNTSTVFKYTVTYIDPDNEGPTQITIKVNGGTAEPMTASTPGDTFFLDGNEYFYETTLGIGSSHNYEFSASDGVYTRGIGPFDGPDVLNTAPNITTPDNATAQEDWYYEVDYEYEDIDIANVGQVGVWNISSNASWLEFNTTTGVLNGTPTNDEVGDYWVNITINDTMDIDWVYFILTVNNTNDPPSLLPDELPHAIEDEFYEVVLKGDDIDKPPQTLTWHLKTNASWLTFNNTLHKINGTPTNAMVGGEYWVDVTVKDGKEETHRNYTLIVDNVNDLPVITTDDVTTTIIDELYSVAYEATDDDLIHGDVLTWALDTNAAWLALNTSTGVLSGTPTALGTHYVNVSVDDGHGGLDYSNFTLTVEEPPILNDPPVITVDNVLTATVDVEYYVVYNATDDHTMLLNLTWTWETDAAAWLDFNATSRELGGTPAETDVGLWWVNITVADDDAVPLMAYTNFTINVTKPPEPSNHEPELSNGGMSPASGDEDTLFTFSVHYTDEDGNPPTSIKVVIDGEEHDMFLKEGENATDGIYELKKKLGTGNHTYYFKANDGELEAVPGDTTTPTAANVAETLSIKEAEEDEDGTDWILWVAIIIIIVIIIAILAFAMMRRKPAARPPEERAPSDEEEELEEWEEDEEGEEGDEEEWEEDEEGEEGEEEEWEAEEEEGEEEEAEEEEEEEAEEEEGEEEEEAEEEEAEELEEEEAEEEEEEAEEEWEDEEAEEELPPVKSIDCPKCKTEMEVPFSEDPKVGLECPSCGAKGKISNPYLE